MGRNLSFGSADVSGTGTRDEPLRTSGREPNSISVRKLSYDVSVRPPVRTDSGSRGKKLNRVGKGVPDMYVAFRFWRKTNHLRGNQRSCWSKNLD